MIGAAQASWPEVAEFGIMGYVTLAIVWIRSNRRR